MNSMDDTQCQALERSPIDANALERMAKERPDECFLKGSGVLKLIEGIRRLEAEVRGYKAVDAAPSPAQKETP
jgi:hypothetical protein